MINGGHKRGFLSALGIISGIFFFTRAVFGLVVAQY